MTDDRAAKYLWDAMRVAERIACFTAGRDLDAYLADEMVRSAPTITAAMKLPRDLLPELGASAFNGV